MKRFSVIYLLAAAFLVSGFLGLFAQSKEGTCFMPEDKEHEECIDFTKVWYYAVPHAKGWVLNVRAINSHALPYIWDNGQFLVSNEEWEKVKSALAAQGMSLVCPHPDFRLERDRLKSRDEMCKK